MLTQLKQYLTGLDQYLNNSYRLVILRQATAWIETGIEIHNPLKCWNADPKQESCKIIKKWHFL